MVDETKRTLAVITTELAAAAAAGDEEKLNALIKERTKFKADIAKNIEDAAKKESEALAGDRAKLSARVYAAAIKAMPWLFTEMAKVKATGFTLMDSTPTAAEAEAQGSKEPITRTAVQLKVPEIKERKARTPGASTGGGNTGTSKDEYGMTLAEIVEKFGTAEEKAAILAEKDNSKSWQLKNKVKAAAIKAGTLKPVAK